MRNLVAIMVLLIFFGACKKSLKKPVWINCQDTVYIQEQPLLFKADSASWKATFFGPLQPLVIPLNWKRGILTLHLERLAGVINGPSDLVLNSGNNYFYYTFHIQNPGTLKSYFRDFHSPKTVNPDSSLHIQVMNHEYDIYRNLVKIDDLGLLFHEKDIAMPPKAGTFRAIKKEALSSFYVQPGSATSMPVRYYKNESKKTFEIVLGPLFDAYHNKVADGTRVSFIFWDEEKTSRLESVLLDSYCQVSIPYSLGKSFFLKAQINETQSPKILIK